MPIEDAAAWFQDHLAGLLVILKQPLLWWQLGLLALAAGLAWLAARRWERTHRRLTDDPAATQTRRTLLAGFRRVVFPLLLLLGTGIAASALSALGYEPALLIVINTLILAFLVIRLAMYILNQALRPGPVLQALENTITVVLWVAVALYLLGWFDDVRIALDRLALTMGELRISLLSVLEFALAISFFLLLAAFLAKTIQRRLMRASYLTVGMRVGVSKFAKFALYTFAILVALNAVGINLTTLTVLSGAIGVGIGFGLQRIIANFISGFVLIADRSIKQGDVITVGQSFGWVEQLGARYVVVRDRDGVETLIPNENLMISDVINWSHSDRKIRLKIPVSVSYGDDPEHAMALLLEAAGVSDRVLDDPAPVARLMEFGDNGIALELRVWIQDPQEGITNVRSDVNIAIWRAFKAAGITIPFPQRDVHLRGKDA